MGGSWTDVHGYAVTGMHRWLVSYTYLFAILASSPWVSTVRCPKFSLSSAHNSHTVTWDWYDHWAGGEGAGAVCVYCVLLSCPAVQSLASCVCLCPMSVVQFCRLVSAAVQYLPIVLCPVVRPSRLHCGSLAGSNWTENCRVTQAGRWWHDISWHVGRRGGGAAAGPAGGGRGMVEQLEPNQLPVHFWEICHKASLDVVSRIPANWSI